MNTPTEGQRIVYVWIDDTGETQQNVYYSYNNR